jgi:type I restriction enzyme M protein
MLDTDTKRRIDSCRDILVGKVPDPKSQVEQITIALIYKFMDDMDAEAEELGGKRTFFAGEYDKFGWSKLMAPNMGGFDVLALYSEAIQKMNENPGIPALFRDIFKNAYLPYRDPETLRSFLKEIDSFTYDHSERLGDAFEYLLSVLGSQGDAGQFRTPRHIIDFMVDVIDPKKSESILDPACGTAGFLISAWKHILKNNTKARSGDLLTPDERKYLAANISGYDISPDMVRLSLVNMYLHGFTDPHIVEYDTLTSEEKWNEYADVILANPPFMSPKGGIKPHKRFSVQATRSEVLFVDYMAEHLTPTGRAAIIVPEGIIFQGQTAYKQLRKVLVDTSLVAVVSLPAGVFQPYSGVKTSILILDKSLAKRCDSVLFVKVGNDGFGLGAQRRAVVGSDLPEAAEAVKAFFNHERHEKHEKKQKDSDSFDSVRVFRDFRGSQVVKKEKIAANGEYNLSGERYREATTEQRKFDTVQLGTICRPEYGFTASAADVGDARFVRITDISSDGKLKKEDAKFIHLTSESQKYLLKKGDILVARTGATFGKTMLFDEDYTAVFASYLIRLTLPSDRLLPNFYWAFAQSENYWEQARNLVSGGGQPQFNGNVLTEIKIPLPPLEVQQEIVSEIEGYQKVIDGAFAVIDNYRPHIPINPEWPEIALGVVCRFIDYRGKTPEKTNGGIPLITAKNVRDGYIDPNPREYIAESDYDSWMTRGIPQAGDVLFTTEAPLGNAAEISSIDRFALAQRLIALCPNRETLVGGFLKDVLLSKNMRERIFSLQSGTTVYGIKASVLKEVKIPLPPLATQQAIVAEIEAEQALVNANRELITRFEKKIQATLARVWGEEQPESGV